MKLLKELSEANERNIAFETKVNMYILLYMYRYFFSVSLIILYVLFNLYMIYCSTISQLSYFNETASMMLETSIVNIDKYVMVKQILQRTKYFTRWKI